jgi:hypothetical protein
MRDHAALWAGNWNQLCPTCKVGQNRPVNTRLYMLRKLLLGVLHIGGYPFSQSGYVRSGIEERRVGGRTRMKPEACFPLMYMVTKLATPSRRWSKIARSPLDVIINRNSLHYNG